VQSKLRKMKASWWKQKAENFQLVADHMDSKMPFEELKSVYGPKLTQLYNVNESEHFNKVALHQGFQLLTITKSTIL